MIVCLTGDIHHMSMKTRDQALLGNKTEIECCYPYLEIANSYGITPTLFFTGKAVKEESTKISELYDNYSFEVGGHNYRAFKPYFFYRACKLLFGLANGPKLVQKIDIKLTITAIQEILGVRILMWRNHAYRHDRNTCQLLYEFGIRGVSDDVDTNNYFPQKMENGLYSFPINVLPDHEYLAHSVTQQGNYTIHEWKNLVMNGIVEIKENSGTVATCLIHPACMFIEDKFASFKDLCKYISQYQTLPLIEMLSTI